MLIVHRFLFGIITLLGMSIFAQTPSTGPKGGQNEPTVFQSAEQQTSLMERYTSEGCSSCPPAEEWLTKPTDSPRLWKHFVPVAFHVDYWDYLGWRDPWGNKQY